MHCQKTEALGGTENELAINVTLTREHTLQTKRYGQHSIDEILHRDFFFADVIAEPNKMYD